MPDETAVLARLRAECQSHGSQAAWAKANGLTPQFISDVLAGRRGVTERLACLLGFKLVYMDLRGEDK